MEHFLEQAEPELRRILAEKMKEIDMLNQELKRLRDKLGKTVNWCNVLAMRGGRSTTNQY